MKCLPQRREDLPSHGAGGVVTKAVARVVPRRAGPTDARIRIRVELKRRSGILVVEMPSGVSIG